MWTVKNSQGAHILFNVHIYNVSQNITCTPVQLYIAQSMSGKFVIHIWYVKLDCVHDKI